MFDHLHEVLCDLLRDCPACEALYADFCGLKDSRAFECGRDNWLAHIKDHHMLWMRDHGAAVSSLLCELAEYPDVL